MKRRDFLLTAGGGALILATASPFMRLAMAMTEKPVIKAIAFDAFPVFDPRPIFALVKSIFPEHENFAKAWFSKIFSYTWLRTNGRKYIDFYSVIGQALDYTVEQHKVSMSAQQRKELMSVWFTLKPWPDVAAALDQFEKQNIKLAFLSNFTEEMLRANARNGNIEEKFQYFSTDQVLAYKPDPKAYQMGVERFNLPKENIAFCAFAAWDAAGANWFGYPTVWVNRLGQQTENLDQGVIVTGKEIDALTHFVQG